MGNAIISSIINGFNVCMPPELRTISVLGMKNPG